MPETLTLHAVERSTYIVTASFMDETDTPVTPTALTWSLTDMSGKVVNNRAAVSVPPAEVVVIILTGDDLVVNGLFRGQKRIVTVEALYDSSLGAGLSLRDQAIFIIDTLAAVS